MGDDAMGVMRMFRSKAVRIMARPFVPKTPRKPSKPVSHGVPICGFVGINGAGKTLLAVDAAIYDLMIGREVYSTVEIRSPWGNSKPITSLRQLLELRDVTILLDEVSVIFSSRTTQSLPNEIVTMLQTVRHRKNTILWSAPAWMRCDNLLREVTQAVVNVLPLMRVREPDNPWPRPRLVAATLLDTSQGKTDAQPDKRIRMRLVQPKRLASYGTYDTLADTPSLARHVHSSVCPDCYGAEARPKHSKQRHDELGLPWTETDQLALI